MKRPSLPVLPITEALGELEQALEHNTRVCLQAPPGAGKSTVLPLVVLAHSWLGGQKILLLEPRRIAARAVASRMAQLLGEPVGKSVGYRTRLDTRVGGETRVEVLTEGILIRMLQDDPELAGVGCVIFDEFHERSLNADLGLALCIESQLNLREELRILVMSATLDLLPLARLLDDAPIVTATGRSFDVVTHYVARRNEHSLELQMANIVRRALVEHAGDILCFLPGAAEIGRVQRALQENPLELGALILPLYGDMSAAGQDAALAPAPAGLRKVVLATSVAETSITIEGIRVVVDSGLRRYTEFDPTTGMSRLTTTKISQAAADQRRGRAGRLSDGVCYRLWSESVQASLAPQTPPEIRHADLAPLALELSCWGIMAGSLRWLDPPPSAHLRQARDLLERLEAIEPSGRITLHGRALAAAGTHPRLAHMLVKSSALGASRLACDLAALLSERDILHAAANARDVDVRLRVSALRGELRDLPPGMTVDTRALAQAARSSGIWRREFARGRTDSADPHEWTGALLALAYPDRIGKARGKDGRYLLANGRGARFAEPQALSKSEFIVAVELDGAEREARIFLAAPLRAADIERLFAEHIVNATTIAWDTQENAVRARRERRLGALLVESTDIPEPDPDALRAAAMTGLRTLGIAALPWTRELRQWQARVAIARRLEVRSSEGWPDLTDATLADALENWAAPWISTMTRGEHFSRIDLGSALRSHLSYAQSSILDEEAPTHFVVPSGSRIPIDYLDGDIPTLSVRLQEIFGLKATPSIANGRLALLMKLLSPAGRPVQVTRDLASFWDRGYHEVKKDLKGRYPKHHWPDDPHSAVATRRARPSGAGKRR